MTAGPILSASRLEWQAEGRRILGPLDLDILAGECLAVVGPNGAGKTTLLRLLTGVLHPAAGERRWEGVPFTRFSRRDLARRIAYVPQMRPVRVPFTVEQMVLLGRYPYLSPLRAAPAETDFQAMEEALARVGLQQLRKRRLEALSGGERQSVYIASALAQGAPLLVLDEPTTHLDPRHQRQVASLLRELNGEAGRTVVFATHDLNFAALLAHRILALRGGRILACRPPAEILQPEILAELFDAPFQVVRGADRPLTVPDLGGTGS